MFLLAIIHFLILAFLVLYFYRCYHYGDNPLKFRQKYTKWKIILWGVLSGEAILLLLGSLHIFDIVDFDEYFQYVIVIPFVALGVGSLISFPVLWTVQQKEREALTTHKPDNAAIQTALKAGHVSEAMSLYKAVNCLNKTNVKAILHTVLPPLPIRDTIEQCTNELLALHNNSNNALVAGAPQELVSKLTEESNKVLNVIWMITDRIVAVSRQNIDSPRIKKAINTHEKKMRHLTKEVHKAREDFAEWTLNGWDIADIEKAQQNLSDFLTQYRDQMDSNE